MTPQEREAARTGSPTGQSRDNSEHVWFDGHPELVHDTVAQCEKYLAAPRFLDGICRRAYQGQSLLGGMGGNSVPTGGLAATVAATSMLSGLDGLVVENLLKSVLDGAIAQIVRPPRFAVLTDGSRWKQQYAARKVGRLLTELSSRTGLEAAVAPCLLDAMTTMVGATAWEVTEDGRVTCERVPPHELSWNPAEGTNPRTIFRRTGVPRRALKKRFPKLALDIENHAPRYRPPIEYFLDDVMIAQAHSDLVEVCIACRRAEGDDVGRYTMTTGTLALMDDPWPLQFWPIVPLRWAPSYQTFAGLPLARQVLPHQIKNTAMSDAIAEVQAKLAIPKVFAPNGAIEQWTNAVEVIPCNLALGLPQILPGASLPPDFYAEKANNKASAYELAGVSQASASATKVEGLPSARAQREQAEMAGGRLVVYAQTVERWIGENGRVSMGLMGHAFKDAARPDKVHGQDVDWSAFDAIKEDVRIRCFITSAIPETGAGRAETIAEQVQAGVINQRRAVRMYASPDVSRWEDLESAAEDLALKIIESALNEGHYIPPEPIMGPDGLGAVVELGGKELMSALLQREPPPDDHIELLRRLIAEAQLLLKPPPAAAPPGPAPAPPGPPGAGAPAPAPMPEPQPAAMPS